MSELSPEVLAQLRQFPSTPVEPLLEGRAVDRREVTVPGPDGARIPLSIFSPAGTDQRHGGAVRLLDPRRRHDHGRPLLADRHPAGVARPCSAPSSISVDYRLAPEVTGTTLVEDCYQGLLWVAEHAGELGIDPARIIVAGTSAGGGLAAGSP